MKSYFYKHTFLIIVLMFLSMFNIEQTIAQINIKDNKLQQNKITSVTAKLEQQLAENKITIDAWAKNIVYSIFEPGKLPLEYKNLERGGLQTWILSTIFNNWSKLNISTKLELQKYGFNNNGALAPPSGLDSTRETTHFKFHYSVFEGDPNTINPADADSNNTPDYIDSMMTVFEHVWTVEIDSFGYTVPPPDSTFGGNSKYDIYIFKLSSGTLGFESPDSTIKDNPNSSVTEINAATSHLAMRNEYSQYTAHTQLENIQVTAAHEFFHSIQDGYDKFAKRWMQEATSTWMEDELYDNINDNYGYLTNWFAQPWSPLDAIEAESNNHWYGSWIFFRYISEHIGNRNTIREIWEKTINYRNDSTDYSFNEIDDVLSLHGTNFKNVFRDFLASNYIRTIAPYNYEEGANYPEINIIKKMFGNMNYQTFIYRHGATYIRISPNLLPVGNDQITFTLTPIDTNANFEAEIVTTKGNVVNTNVFTSNFILNNTKDLDDIIVIVMDFSTFAEVGMQQLNYKLNIQSNSSMYNITKGHKVRIQKLSNSNFALLTENYTANGQAYVNYFKTNFPLKTFTLSKYQSNSVYLYLTNQFIPVMQWGFWDGFFSYYINGTYKEINTSNIATDIHLLAADEDLAWFGGDSLWAYNMNNNSIENLGFVGYNGNWGYYDKKIIVAGSSAAWLTQTGDIYVKNGIFSPQLIAQNFSPDGNWDFNGSVLVWTDKDNLNNYRIKAYNVNTDNYFTIDSSGSRGRLVVTGSLFNDIHIAFRDDSQFPFKYYYTTGLPVTSKKELNVPGDGYLLINDAGVGLEIMKTKQTPQFYFHSFISGNDYTTYLSDYTAAEPFSSNGDYIRMLDSTFYFDAINLTKTDKTVYIYSVKMGDIVTGISSNKINIPKEFSLSQNYPNPFNPTTTISYQLSAISRVTLKIYDILGREVTTLVNEEQPAGNYKINFDASRLASGVYFYRITATVGTGSFVQAKKMILMK